MSDKHPSIRRRLLAALLGTIALIWGGVSFTVYLSAGHEVEEVYDAILALDAKIMAGLLAHEVNEDEADAIGEIGLPGQLQHPYELKIALRAYFPDGRLAINTPGAPEIEAPEEDGFANEAHAGVAWRIFRFTDPATGVRVITAQQYEIREELVRQMLQRSLISLLLAMPMLALVIWWGIGRGLQPLRSISSQLANRDSASLKPLSITEAPKEVHVFVMALNRLFARLEQSFEKEKRFTADAAHELRTPLSGIKLQAQVAQRALAEEQRERALEQIVRGVDRATHLVNQLLELARLDAPCDRFEAHPPRAELLRIARERIALATHLADQKGIELTLDVSGDSGEIWVVCDEALLHSLLRNLIENAIRYSPPDSRVELLVAQRSDAMVRVQVQDQGPGIQEEKLQQMFERFRRGDMNEQVGSGLGLSIVRRICDIHQIVLKMTNREEMSGLRVELLVPLSDQS